MRKFEFFKILSLVGLLLTGACSDFLEEKSQDEVIPKTVADYSEVLVGYMYSYGWQMLLALDDDLKISTRFFESSGTDNDDALILMYSGCFTWQSNMWEREYALNDNYKLTYTQIMGINAVLDGIDDAEGTVEKKELVKAEALGLRAFGYYMLVNLYGEPYNYNKKALGVPLKLTAALTENGIARSTVEEVYARIVEDLETASGLFNKYPKQRENYRMNGTTVDILLSRVYLYMEEWDEAIKAANRAIETAEGLTDYTKISPDLEFRMETYDHSEVEWLYGKEIIPYQFDASDTLLSKYKNGDRRKEFWFDLVVNEDEYKGTNVLKKKNLSSTSPSNTIRISEAYLNRAEAYLQSNQPNKIVAALADLDELRRHRIVGYQNISITEEGKLLDEIRTERRLEFCFDGQRWFDLRRYGMPPISRDYKAKPRDPWVTYTLREKDPLYTLPIPSLMMENNIKLEQNSSANEPERGGVVKSNL